MGARRHLHHGCRDLALSTRATAEDQRLLRALLQPRDNPQDPSLDAYGLTGREALILALLATGKNNAEIALELAISPQTVKKHLDHVYTKLQVSRRTAAAIRALRLDLPAPEHHGPHVVG